MAHTSRSEDKLKKLALSFHHVGPGIKLRSSSLVPSALPTKLPYQPSNRQTFPRQYKGERNKEMVLDKHIFSLYCVSPL